mgnify:FL=1
MVYIKKAQKLFVLLLFLFLNSCGSFSDIDWSKPAEPSGKKRARDNVKEGKGIIFGGGNKETNFLFASSNPLWRASLETIDFMSLSSVDYAGGLIISDWYSEGSTSEAVKITITFLSNEIRSDGLIIDIRKRNCNQNNQCVVKKIETDLNIKIKDKILRRAAVLDKDLKAKIKKKRPKKLYPDD